MLAAETEAGLGRLSIEHQAEPAGASPLTNLTKLTNLTNLTNQTLCHIRGMSTKLNLYAAKTQLSALVERAAGGEEFIIAKAEKPLARLGPVRVKRTPRRFGAWKGKIRIAADFDAPLPPEILAAFAGRS